MEINLNKEAELKKSKNQALLLLLSVITQFDGLLFTIGDGRNGQEMKGQQNGTGIATGAVLALGG